MMALFAIFAGNVIKKVLFNTVLSDPKFNTAIERLALVAL
jgi:hypothetical protein